MKRKGIIISSKENPLLSLKRELDARGDDVTVLFREDLKSCEQMSEKAEELGAPDYLIISALCDSALIGKNLCELTTEEYKDWKFYSLIQFYEINAAFVKRMIANGGGKVLGVIPAAGRVPSKNE